MISFVLNINRSFDTYKMFIFYKNSSCEISDGLGIFSEILEIYFYAGIVINTAVVTFNNPFLWNLDLQVKFGFFFCFINFFLTVNFLISIDTIPSWFKNIYLFESEFKKKFLQRRKFFYLNFSWTSLFPS